MSNQMFISGAVPGW